MGSFFYFWVARTFPKFKNFGKVRDILWILNFFLTP